MLTSMVCRQEHFESEWYGRWWHKAHLSGPDPVNRPFLEVPYHRKAWEFCAISQALYERDLLRPGSRGVGFAVGHEPLSSLFASMGCNVLASDLGADGPEADTWEATKEHASSPEDLYHPYLVDRATFDRNVTFAALDMRDEWRLTPGTYDFVWSSCSFEHLGNMQAGLDFVVRSAQLLRPGGVAVHTTEYTVSSNDLTTTEGVTVLYRKRDMEELDGMLRQRGFCLAHPDFFPGDDCYDRLYDFPPYFSHGRQHVKLLYDGLVTTSFLVIVLA